MTEQGGKWRVPTKQERLRIHIRKIIQKEIGWIIAMHPLIILEAELESCDKAAQKILRYLRRMK